MLKESTSACTRDCEGHFFNVIPCWHHLLDLSRITITNLAVGSGHGIHGATLNE